jgi:hypothetical protein
LKAAAIVNKKNNVAAKERRDIVFTIADYLPKAAQWEITA